MNHELKTEGWAFRQSWEGNKPFEIRDNRDRGFQKGDTVTLNEIDPIGKLGRSGQGLFVSPSFTGRKIDATISFVTGFKQNDGYVVMGLTGMENHDLNHESLA